jgi:hypothetical protein
MGVQIPSNANRKSPRDFDRDTNKTRQSIKSFFAKLRRFRVIAIHREETARNVLAAAPYQQLFDSIDCTAAVIGR